MNQNQYANHRGVNRSFINRNKHRLVWVDGKIDVRASDVEFDRTADPRRIGTVRSKPTREPTPGRAADMEALRLARIRMDAARADRLEREEKQRRGELVEKADVVRGAEALGKAVGATLDGLAQRLGLRLAAAFGGDARIAGPLLADEITSIRRDLSDGLRKIVGDAK